MPGPHEVVFYSETEDSPGVMLWRYPEPRVLTFVRITPVPFNTTEDPEISTADLGDVLQVEMDTHTACLDLKKNVNMLYSQSIPQPSVKERVVSDHMFQFIASLVSGCVVICYKQETERGVK